MESMVVSLSKWCQWRTASPNGGNGGFKWDGGSPLLRRQRAAQLAMPTPQLIVCRCQRRSFAVGDASDRLSARQSTSFPRYWTIPLAFLQNLFQPFLNGRFGLVLVPLGWIGSDLFRGE
jgi:hypothetical protein